MTDHEIGLDSRREWVPFGVRVEIREDRPDPLGWRFDLDASGEYPGQTQPPPTS
jgi:hypothetical protein